MKTTIAILFLGLIANAQASYYATHCSTASASVNWESGHNSNTISFKYYEETQMIKKLNLQEVVIKLQETHVILEENSQGCMNSIKRVYLANATITPSADHPRSMDFLQYPGPLKAQVLCEFNMNSRGRCP